METVIEKVCNKLVLNRLRKQETKIGMVYKVIYSSLETKNKRREFVGLCIRVGKNNRYTLRNIVDNVGVEVSFDIDSANVIDVEDFKYYKGLYRRSKLYYLRDKGLNNSRITWR